jgi:hypothetical protein
MDTSLNSIRFPFFCCLFLLLLSCSAPLSKTPVFEEIPARPVAQQPAVKEDQTLSPLGFAVQVGAFSELDNAVRFESQLKQHGVDAYFFLHESGLYKVRFGNHPSYELARWEAESLQDQGLIERFFIIVPDDYAAVRIQRSGEGDLRQELVKTTQRFLGVPYRWGGENAKTGFDCSGLMMVSYHLNGLDMPRNSRAQFDAGKTIRKAQLRQGDLVFFATQGGTRVTHVGMYIGDNKFIHAPKPGKTVRIANLSSSYYRRTFVGAKTYL